MSSVSRIQVHRPGTTTALADSHASDEITPSIAVAIAERHARSRGWAWPTPIGLATRLSGPSREAKARRITAYEIWTRADWWGDQVRIVVDARTGRVLESSFVVACFHQHHEG